MKRSTLPLLGSLALAACSCGATPTEPARPESPPIAPVPASYEVHEWGLVRGTMLDQVMISGPHRAEIAVPLAKPVLYFHRDGEGALSIDVGVSIANGRIVEHWPLSDHAEPRLEWRGVEVTEGSCAGSRYPSDAEPPCASIVAPDSCEAATLATVETDDGDCVRYGGASYDHLFYRGEVRGAPALPLRLERDGEAVRATLEDGSPIPGSVVRIRRSTREVSVAAAPAPGGSVVLPPPSSSSTAGAEALDASLHAAGLTDAEVAAFRRAWDVALFGGEIAAGESPPGVVTATPMGGLVRPSSDDAILYVLPIASADALAPLTFAPAPRAVRRAIVAWIDVGSGNPARP